MKLVNKLHHKLSRYHPKLYYGKLSWLFTSADRLGVEFLWHGDWIIWLWPWRRRREGKQRKWLSTSFQATFTSLKEIDDLWQDYWEHMNDAAETSRM